MTNTTDDITTDPTTSDDNGSNEWMSPADIHLRIKFKPGCRRLYLKHLEAVAEKLKIVTETMLESHDNPYEIESITAMVRRGYWSETEV